MPSPSIRQIARALGLGRTTVADALRNDPVVAKATRERVQREAERMGYKPDARINQLMSYLRQGRRRSARCNLAWLNTWPRKSFWSEPWVRGYLVGAKERAAKLGYVIEEVWAADPAVPPERLQRLILARGVEGLVLPLVVDEGAKVPKLDLNRFACVVVEAYHNELPFNRVSTHHLHNIQTVLKRVHELGYRRPALRMTEFGQDNNGHCFWQQFLYAQQTLFEGPPIPILKDDPLPRADAMGDWIRAHKPDILIGGSNTLVEELARVGIRVPQDLALVHINVAADTPGWAGISQCHDKLGEAAVDVLIAQIHRGETGRPPLTKEILIRGTWVDGWTCPPKKRG